MTKQPRLWTDNIHPNVYYTSRSPANSDLFYWYNQPPGSGRFNRTFFVTALQNETTTGALRQHAMRLNSSIECSHVPRSNFPSTCPGARPFTNSFSHSLLDIRVCIPGEYGVYAWTPISHRQDLAEELFLDVFFPISNSDQRELGRSSNFTLYCQAETTRGYLELSNYRNNYTHGPLLTEWPGPVEMANEFNDYLGLHADFPPPSEQ